MFRDLFFSALFLIFSLSCIHTIYAREPESDGSYIIEENIDKEAMIVPQGKTEPAFVTADILRPEDVEPAINYYIRSDINRKFSGLITNLKLEKIYGIYQEGKTASVYFDYSYVSIRNRENILFEKGKMTFMQFNSGRWFNPELSIFLSDSYPAVPMEKRQGKEE